MLQEIQGLADGQLTDREVAAAKFLSAQAALWRGDLDLARRSFLGARALWRALREPLAESQSQAALWWIDLLRDEPPHPGEVRQAEAEARDRGQADQADMLACIAAVAASVDASPEADDVEDELLTLVAPLVHRGHRLGAAVCLSMAAAVTSSEALREHAAELAVGTELAPPKLGRWAH